MQNAAKISYTNFRVTSVLTKTSLAYKLTIICDVGDSVNHCPRRHNPLVDRVGGGGGRGGGYTCKWHQLFCLRISFASPFFTNLWNEGEAIVIEHSVLILEHAQLTKMC
jgi:hypothetical protein